METTQSEPQSEPTPVATPEPTAAPVAEPTPPVATPEPTAPAEAAPAEAAPAEAAPAAPEPRQMSMRERIAEAPDRETLDALVKELASEKYRFASNKTKNRCMKAASKRQLEIKGGV